MGEIFIKYEVTKATLILKAQVLKFLFHVEETEDTNVPLPCKY